MSRRGFALLTVLWLVAALSLLAGASLAFARLGSDASRNRLLLARAEWAREACGEILLARYPAAREVDTVDLGRGTWCRATVEDAGASLDLNRASAEALRRIVGSDSLADALLDWRDGDDIQRPLGAESEWYVAHGWRPPRNGPFAAVAELRRVRGFEAARVDALARLLTVRGAGRIDLNAAPPEVLATVPGLGAEAIASIMAGRRRGDTLASADALMSRLSHAGRGLLLDRYQEFMAGAAFSPERLEATVEGGIEWTAIVSRAVLTLVPTAGRLAVVRREAE